MQIKSNLIDNINGTKPIEFSDKDSLGCGTSAEVFRYSIQNKEVALKCFTEEDDAQKEHALYEKILCKVACCPGFV